ncbi:unnamed protein product [Tenebrio molitor]|nr:unnamed protein product [Tenebrio molitor]
MNSLPIPSPRRILSLKRSSFFAVLSDVLHKSRSFSNGTHLC